MQEDVLFLFKCFLSFIHFFASICNCFFRQVTEDNVYTCVGHPLRWENILFSIPSFSGLIDNISYWYNISPPLLGPTLPTLWTGPSTMTSAQPTRTSASSKYSRASHFRFLVILFYKFVDICYLFQCFGSALVFMRIRDPEKVHIQVINLRNLKISISKT